MKHFKMLCVIVAVVATLFSCNGTGKDVKPAPNNPGNSGGSDNPGAPSFKGDKVTIEFDAKIMIVHNYNEGARQLPSGKEVKVGTKLYCVPKDDVIKNDEIFDGFLFNKKKVDGYFYTVDASDAVKKGDKGVITITLSKRKKSTEKVKIVFGGNIEADAGRGRNSISTGEEVEDGTFLIFTAQESEGKMLETWLVNGNKKASSSQRRNALEYIVNVKDAKKEGNDNVIEVKFTEIEAKTITMQFDEEVIKAITNADTREEIKQNEAVKVGTYIIIHHSDIKKKKEQVVDSWLLNGKKTTTIINDGPGYMYVVDDKDAKTEGGKLVIKIGLKLRDAEKIKLKFDDANIVAGTRGGPGVPPIEYKNGDSVDEGVYVDFALKDDNKIVEKWLCNKEEYVVSRREANVTWIQVSKDKAKKEGNDYVIHMEAVTRDAKSFTLKFDAPIICKYSIPNGQVITSGTSLKENTAVTFLATLPADKVGENWLVNDKKKAEFRRNYEFYYTVKADDAKDGVIEVKISMHESKTATLVLEKDEIKVRRDGSSEQVNNGSEVKEGERLSFRIEKQQEDKIVDKWIINGKKYGPNSDTDSIYIYDDGDMNLTLKSEHIVQDGGKNVLKVSYEERDLEDIKIEFDVQQMECKKRDNNGEYIPVQSGDKVREKTQLHFELKDGVFAETWLVGKKGRWGGSLKFHFSVYKSYAVNKGGEPVITVKIEKREPFDCSIIFDPQRVSCKNGNDNLKTGATVKEGTELTFTALGIQLEDDERLYWSFVYSSRQGDRGKTTIKYKVDAGDASNNNNGVRKINVTWSR